VLEPLDTARWMHETEELAGLGLRVLAIAERRLAPDRFPLVHSPQHTRDGVPTSPPPSPAITAPTVATPPSSTPSAPRIAMTQQPNLAAPGDASSSPESPAGATAAPATAAQGDAPAAALSPQSPSTPVTPLSFAEVQQGLVLLGIVGIFDPPRPEAKQAIAQCHRAGIQVIVITGLTPRRKREGGGWRGGKEIEDWGGSKPTKAEAHERCALAHWHAALRSPFSAGDHARTAAAIGRMLNLFSDDGKGRICTSTELAAMSDEQLRREVRQIAIFARSTPADKLRIVQALQANGCVTGPTSSLSLSLSLSSDKPCIAALPARTRIIGSKHM